MIYGIFFTLQLYGSLMYAITSLLFPLATASYISFSATASFAPIGNAELLCLK